MRRSPLNAQRVCSCLAGAIVAVLFACPIVTVATDGFSGKVVAIQDGDTISVLRGDRPERVRLHGIDAPEDGQDLSNRAKQFLAELAFEKVAAVEVRDIDRYGRTVGRVGVEGQDMGLELVRAGLAARGGSQFSQVDSHNV